MLKKIRTTIIALGLVALAVPALAADGTQFVQFQDGEYITFDVVPRSREIVLVAGLDEDEFGFASDLDTGAVCGRYDPMHLDVRHSDDAITAWFPTAE